MKLLITGATGRVGTALVERLAGIHSLRLLAHGDPADVSRAKERLVSHFGGDVGARIESGEIEVECGDLELPGLGLDSKQRRELSHDVDGILHLAALTDFEDPGDDRHHRVNVGGALEIARLAAANCKPIPLLLVSTAYVSGDHDGEFAETDRDVGQGFHNPYERSKLAAEHAVIEFARRSNVPCSIFRLGVVMPDAPRAGLATGPGPLVFLEFLAGLEGRGVKRTGSIRYTGDVAATLNMVSLEATVEVLARAAARMGSLSGVYHVTARRPTSIGRIAKLVNEQIPTLEIALVPTKSLDDPAGADRPDRIEKMLARHCRPYAPYLFAYTVHRRERLDRDVDLSNIDLELDEAALRRIFAVHVAAWRGTRRSGKGSAQLQLLANSIEEYFGTFLPPRMGARLVPGLESLTADFTVSVPRVGIYRLRIVQGILDRVERADRPSSDIDYESDASSFLEAVRGEVRPSELFFQRRVTIRGDLYRALSTATALEDFFALHPFAQSRPA